MCLLIFSRLKNDQVDILCLTGEHINEKDVITVGRKKKWIRFCCFARSVFKRERDIISTRLIIIIIIIIIIIC